MKMQIIKISKKNVEYNSKENLNEHYDLAEHLTRDIFDEKSSIIIGNKKSYLLYRGKNYDEVGYCYSIGYSMDVIRTEFAQLMSKDKQYEIHIKKLSPTEYKIYLYEYSLGYVYNGLTLIEKFKIREIPKIEKKEEPLLDQLESIRSKKSSKSPSKQKSYSRQKSLPTIHEEEHKKQKIKLH